MNVNTKKDKNANNDATNSPREVQDSTSSPSPAKKSPKKKNKKTPKKASENQSSDSMAEPQSSQTPSPVSESSTKASISGNAEYISASLKPSS